MGLFPVAFAARRKLSLRHSIVVSFGVIGIPQLLLLAAAISSATASASTAAASGIAAATTTAATLATAASGFLISLEAGLSAIAGCERISAGLIATQGAITAAGAAIVFRETSGWVRRPIGGLGSSPIFSNRIGGRSPRARIGGPISCGRIGGPSSCCRIRGLIGSILPGILPVPVGLARDVGKRTGFRKIGFRDIGIRRPRGILVVRPRRRNSRVVRTIVSTAAVGWPVWPVLRIRSRSRWISRPRIISIGWAISGRPITSAATTRISTGVHVVISDVDVVVVLDRTTATVAIPTAAPMVVAIVDKRPKQNPGSK